MSDKNRSRNLTSNVVRWTARIGSLASAALLMAFMFGGNEQPPDLSEAPGLVFFPGGVLLGMLVGWWKELIGGLVTAGSLAAFYVWHFMDGGSWPTGPYFLLFALPGLLFLASWFVDRLGRTPSRSVGDTTSMANAGGHGQV